jgi:hypothetical protein
MKALAMTALIGLAAPSAQEGGEGPARQAEHLARAIGWLADADPEVREMGRQTLLAAGPLALAALEKDLEAKGSLEQARLLSRLLRAPAPGGWVGEEEVPELPQDEEFQKELKKVDPAAVTRYVRLKYAEAMAGLRSKNYHRGYEIANALLTLEPRGPEADALRRLRRHCEAMITQTTLIEAKFVQPRLWFVAGDPVEISARMKNVYRGELTLEYDAGTAEEPGGGILILEVDIRVKELRGAGLHERKPFDLRFEREIPIAPGAQWERRITLDPSISVPDEEHIREITVNAWTQPVRIRAEGASFTRRLQFEPAVVRIVPKRYAAYLERPLEWLERTMEGGTVQEVFICSQMLEGADREKGLDRLVVWMGKAETELGRIAAGQILTAMTGQTLGTDPVRWMRWLQERDAAKKKDKNAR